jgi:RNA recognition motif-containing protein
LGRGDDGRSRGFCHVAYKTVDGAEKALQLSDTSFYGRDIVVQMAKSEEERNAERDARRANRPPPPPPQGCWFCLSNEKDTHLVASIAS